MVPDSLEQMKRAAAERAAEWIEDGMAVGLGTGSTVRHLLEHIAEQRQAGRWPRIVGVATSLDTQERAERLGIPMASLAEHPHLDLTIDGADEVDPELRLIKGLGGALLREKIVAAVSESLVIIVDETKLVDRLGTRVSLPVEVDPFALPVVGEFFLSLGADPCLRRNRDGEPYRTDGGHRIFDLRFPSGIDDPDALEVALNRRPGVVENGLFLGLTDRVVVATPGGVDVRSREAGS